MKTSSIECFISYCHSDTDKESVRYFVQWLRSKALKNLQILWDADLKAGTNLRDFMARTKTAAGVVVLLSPEYKRRAEGRTGGVYDEYKYIVERLDNIEDQKRAGTHHAAIERYVEVVPIIFSGSFDESVPAGLRDLKCLNLVGLHDRWDDAGKLVIPLGVDRRYGSTIQGVVDIFDYLDSTHRNTFAPRRQAYNDKLFIDLKAPIPRNEDFLGYDEATFVKTFAFRKIEQQAVYFVVGRKGSGKSTIASAMGARNEFRYKGLISITADDFNLEALYSQLTSPKVKSDIRAVFSTLGAFQFCWDLFLHLCASSILLDLQVKGRLNGYQKSKTRSISTRLTDITAIASHELSEGERNQVFFTFAFSQIKNFIDDCIRQSRNMPEFFEADLQALFTRQRFLGFAFGDDALKDFEDIVATCKKKFLVTLDGFDNAFDHFRTNTIIRGEPVEERSAFEIEWLRALVTLVLRIREPHDAGHHSGFHRLLDFCITIPRDRFQEVRTFERDSYRLHGRFCPLEWSGIELSILLRKRLEKISEHKTNRPDRPHVRLADVHSYACPQLPTQLRFEYAGRQIGKDLYHYVLRHSFWRPREVLMYYAALMATAEEMRIRQREMTPEIIRRVVRETTYEVIQSEFIGEFRSTILNIEDIVISFSNARQVLTKQDISGFVGQVDFRLAAGHSESTRVEEKIETLFEIGFIGVRLDDEQMTRFNIRSRDAFYFNEGYGVLRHFRNRKYGDCSFLIHPAFCEFLGIRAEEFVLDFDWDYLYESEDVQRHPNI